VMSTGPALAGLFIYISDLLFNLQYKTIQHETPIYFLPTAFGRTSLFTGLLQLLLPAKQQDGRDDCFK
jgi:hypothetical protein